MKPYYPYRDEKFYWYPNPNRMSPHEPFVFQIVLTTNIRKVFFDKERNRLVEFEEEIRLEKSVPVRDARDVPVDFVRKVQQEFANGAKHKMASDVAGNKKISETPCFAVFTSLLRKLSAFPTT